jgi:hypothetical protein
MIGEIGIETEIGDLSDETGNTSQMDANRVVRCSSCCYHRRHTDEHVDDSKRDAPVKKETTEGKMVLDQNNDEGEIPPPEETAEEDMMAMMGFAGFGTTKVSCDTEVPMDEIDTT